MSLALFGHLLGVLAFFAGMAVAGAAQLAARRQARARDVALLLGLARSGVALVGAGLVLLLACGFWLLGETAYGLGDGWVEAALALVVLSGVLGGLGGRRPRQARELAGRLSGADGDAPVTPALRSLLDDRVTDLANAAALVVAVAIVALMVWKPG